MADRTARRCRLRGIVICSRTGVAVKTVDLIRYYVTHITRCRTVHMAGKVARTMTACTVICTYYRTAVGAAGCAAVRHGRSYTVCTGQDTRCGVTGGAGVMQLIVAGTQGGLYPTVGASGGVFGILLAYGMAFPNRTIMLLFPPIPMKAKYFVLFYGLLELYLGLSGNAPGVANFAHLGGMLFGFLLLRHWNRPRRRG